MTFNLETIKSSAEWVAETGVTILDPDGWDRRNFDESWAEPITYREFWVRASLSTISGGLGLP